MKNRTTFGNVWALLLAAGVSTVGLACAQNVPTPPILLPFDVAAAADPVDQLVRIAEKRSYHVDLNIYYSNQDDMPNVRRLAGDGTRYADGRYAEPGTIVPIHLRIVVEGDRQNDQVLYDKTVATQGHYSHGFLRSDGGYYARTIGGIVLAPGLYRVSAKVTESIPALAGIKTYLSITYDARFPPISD
jgi:hypothetical protein